MLAKTDYYILYICIRGLFKSQQAAKICHFAGCSRACPYAHIPSIWPAVFYIFPPVLNVKYTPVYDANCYVHLFENTMIYLQG